MNAEQDDPWHRPPLPLRNFRDIGPLTQADESAIDAPWVARHAPDGDGRLQRRGYPDGQNRRA